MNAIQVTKFGGPEVLALAEVPNIEPPSGCVVVRVEAAGVNPVDTYIRTGTYAFQPPLPYTPGMDAAGTVRAVAEDVTGLAPGDRVYVAGSLSGTYAEQTLCAASQVHPLPDVLSFSQGAALGVPYATAHRALFGKAAAKKGDAVLVHGASGGVGIACIQLGRAAGLDVTATAGTDTGRALVAEQGAHNVLDHHDPEHLAAAMAHTGGKGFDVVVEMLANVNLGKDLPVLAPGGRVIVVGSRGEVTIDPRDLMGRDASIHGMTLMNVPEDARAAIHRDLIAGIEAGTVRPIISAELPLSEAPKAHRDVIESSPNGKIVLVP